MHDPSSLCLRVVICRYCTEGYRDLPFPFDDIGLGREGEPASLDMEHEMSFEGLIGMLRSWSAVTTAKQRGVDLLGERVVKELEEEWALGRGVAGAEGDLQGLPAGRHPQGR